MEAQESYRLQDLQVSYPASAQPVALVLGSPMTLSWVRMLVRRCRLSGSFLESRPLTPLESGKSSVTRRSLVVNDVLRLGVRAMDTIQTSGPPPNRRLRIAYQYATLICGRVMSYPALFRRYHWLQLYVSALHKSEIASSSLLLVQSPTSLEP
jgi:hypothetical protein